MLGMSKKIIFSLLAAFCVLPLAAQDDSIMTVEEAYLSSAESVIIKELGRTTGRDAKQVALQYIEEAINGGRMSSDVMDVLKELSGEGVFNTVRENGRVVNNYPDVRMKACELLGKVGTKEAVKTLVSVLYVDSEPSVVTSAVKALCEIGDNENNEVVSMINWIARKFDVVLPTSSLALEVLNAYEQFAPSVENKTEIIENLVRIVNNYNYVTPVRNRAQEVLRIVQSSGNSGSSRSRSNNSSSAAATESQDTGA